MFWVETVFEHRFQTMLRSALHKRSWHVIVADPGSGKTMGIREMIQTIGSLVILAVTTPKTDNEDQTSSTRSKLVASHDSVMDQKHPVKPTKCMFSAVVPIELKRFLDSGIGRVECSDCACMRTLKPQGPTLRFKSYDKRKTRTPNTDQRWARRETSWEVVGGEST